jgi:hypothetical protein
MHRNAFPPNEKTPKIFLGGPRAISIVVPTLACYMTVPSNKFATKAFTLLSNVKTSEMILGGPHAIHTIVAALSCYMTVHSNRFATEAFIYSSSFLVSPPFYTLYRERQPVKCGR